MTAPPLVIIPSASVHPGVLCRLLHRAVRFGLYQFVIVDRRTHDVRPATFDGTGADVTGRA